VTGSTPNPDSLPPDSPPPETPSGARTVWKEEISARVRAHRSRRVPANQPPLPGMEDALSSASIAARVADRYSRLPSWREMLAAQANTKSTVDSPVAAASVPPAEPSQLAPSIAPTTVPSQPAAAAPGPEPYQPDLLLRYSVSSDSLPAPRYTPPQARAIHPDPAHHEEIAPSPADPLEEAFVEPAWPLPARVITSPRELVAPRKARPRLAEGPLSASPQAETPSVAEEPQTVTNSTEEDTGFPVSAVIPASAPPLLDPAGKASPEWHSIHLDTEAPIREPRRSSSAVDELPLHVASLHDRALAALVDSAFTLCAFLLFAAVFAICSTSFPHGRPALVGAAAALFAMGLIYQLLFFTLTDATPGMRYAKIALCTFDDENPAPPRLRGRIAALLLSALPLGLGFLWAVFDEDGLGWHDRITRTYQRSYLED
jgi:uncharacterized RDD family membrane protein YckC